MYASNDAGFALSAGISGRKKDIFFLLRRL
jgi:hypothetical protein